MAENRKEFVLVGKFDDQISKQLASINKMFDDMKKKAEATQKPIGDITKAFDATTKAAEGTIRTVSKLGGAAEDSARSISGITKSLEYAGEAAGKTREVVSQIGEGLKGFDSLAESLSAAGQAAGKARSEVDGIGESLENAREKSEGLISSMLKANALAKVGDAIAIGFQRGVNMIVGASQKAMGLVKNMFQEAAEDQQADIKAVAGVQGALGMQGITGSFEDAQRFYKRFDREIAEMIRTSSAPTAKVVELQRYTMDTMMPLLLEQRGVKKGTEMKDVSDTIVKSSATEYGKFLEKAALLGQGTGSQGIRVASGIEQLVTRGKIDTMLDFFTDNVLLMNSLEKAGFAGRGGKGTLLDSGSTNAERFKKMMEAFNKALSGEATAAMSTSLTGSMQALGDTLTNPSVGIFGMATTYTESEQKEVNKQIYRLHTARINAHKAELQKLESEGRDIERQKQLRANIETATKTRDKLVKEGNEMITTPFLAFSYQFGELVRNLTEALAAVGPLWNGFSIYLLQINDILFAPITRTLKVLAWDMKTDIANKKITQMEAVGRLVGEIFKGIGDMMAKIADMITNPSGPVSKVQSEFLEGFMSAFKDEAGLQRARDNIARGIKALVDKLFEVLKWALMQPELRGAILTAVALIFGPPLVMAVISGVTPLIIMAIGKMFLSLAKSFISRGVTSFKDTRTLLQTPKVANNIVPFSRGPKQLGLFDKPIAPKIIQPELFDTAAATAAPAARIGVLGRVGKALGKLGEGFSKIGKAVPLFSILAAGARFGLGVAGGERKSAAAGGAIGGLAGGLLGGALGALTGPLAPVMIPLLSMAGSWLGDMIGTKLGPAIADLPKVLGPMWDSAINWFKGIPKALEPVWTTAVSWFNITIDWFESLPNQMTAALTSLWNWLKEQPGNLAWLAGYASVKIEKGWQALLKWFKDLPKNFLALIAFILARLQSAMEAYYKWWWGLPGIVWNILLAVISRLGAALEELKNRVGTAVGNVINFFRNYDYGALANSIKEGVRGAVTKAINFIKGINWRGIGEAIKKGVISMIPVLASIVPGGNAALLGVGLGTALTSEGVGRGINKAGKYLSGEFSKGREAARRESETRYDGLYHGPMSLGRALAVESAMKPPGSSLVIANSSETIIPAAGGLGMGRLLETLNNGFASITGGMNRNADIENRNARSFSLGLEELSKDIYSLDKRTQGVGSGVNSLAKYTMGRFNDVDRNMASNHGDTIRMNQSLSKQISSIQSSGFGPLGGAASSLDAAASLATSMGLIISSRFRPGDPGWHGAGRAIDVAGDPSLMMAYARRMAAMSGGRLLELFYTPLGYSIKNGQRVPWFVKGHYDHVHVAMAYGSKNPAFFRSQSDAENWERKMVPSNLRVKTITANSGESFGGNTLNAPITIYQQPGQNAEELATLVAMRIGMAIDSMRNHV